MIVAPRLLPDELAAGYWGRVLLLNGIDGSASNRTRQEFADRLCAERGIEFKGANRGLELISSAAQISATQLLSGHTLVPLHGAVSGVVNSNWFDERYEFRVLRTATAVQDGLKFGALCPQCVEEDRTFWGFAYWRRSHQIPSIPCWRRFKIEPPCRSKFEPGLDAVRRTVVCG